jgi:hypothetical protein
MVGKDSSTIKLGSVTRKCVDCRIEFALNGLDICSECNLKLPENS